MNKLDKICVFCGSSDGNDTAILDAAKNLGETFASEGITLIYGAAKIGVMGTIADATLVNKGKVIGIIPDFLKVKEVVHLGLTELHITENMHDRKLMMQEMSDGFIVLPGGFGTLEEMFEIITWLQLALHDKPIGLLNVNGFYDDLLEMLDTMMQKGFVSQDTMELLLVDTSLKKLLVKMNDFKCPAMPKWLNADRA